MTWRSGVLLGVAAYMGTALVGWALGSSVLLVPSPLATLRPVTALCLLGLTVGLRGHLLGTETGTRVATITGMLLLALCGTLAWCAGLGFGPAEAVRPSLCTLLALCLAGGALLGVPTRAACVCWLAVAAASTAALVGHYAGVPWLACPVDGAVKISAVTATALLLISATAWRRPC